MARSNRAIFVKTNVADTESLRNLIHETVCRFGGLDVFVSNAGVLRAGGLEEMTPENFEFVTKINYNAYFYCAQAASRVMKLQNKYAEDNYGDIIQINSKSGLRGSKANFAYAGGKFGGIGLTQSFALELAPFRIKVNSVCRAISTKGRCGRTPRTDCSCNTCTQAKCRERKPSKTSASSTWTKCRCAREPARKTSPRPCCT
ncbi:MAG: SDR family NAD(P)-dependent oxidoreductase [Alistipes finegoldii]